MERSRAPPRVVPRQFLRVRLPRKGLVTLESAAATFAPPTATGRKGYGGGGALMAGAEGSDEEPTVSL